jgi:alpha-aminoadipic semialdehyde synthase
MITTDKGKLSFKFQYLKSIMKRTNKQPKLQGSSSRSVTILIEGHLFDFGLINQVLDVLDANQCGFEFKECHVEHKTDKEVPVKSQAILCITGDDKTDFQKMESEIVTLISAIEKADASFRRIDENRQSLAYTSDQSDETVLLLGSGRVSKSVVAFLSRSKDRNIMVASNDEKEGREISALAKRGQHVALDAKRDTKRLGDLVRRSNVVISLLPASMHPQIAEMCIDNGTDLVTASYESNRMRELDQR